MRYQIQWLPSGARNAPIAVIAAAATINSEHFMPHIGKCPETNGPAAVAVALTALKIEFFWTTDLHGVFSLCITTGFNHVILQMKERALCV
jgi:hypothetical protein